MFEDYHHLHFIGIGGSGISSLAHLAKKEGKTVSGSDLISNSTTKQLEKNGLEIVISQNSKNIKTSVDGVIYTEAIDKKTNVEFLEAQKRGIKMLSYFEALGKISKHKKTIVVTGTHGKTTTTAMLGKILVGAGLDPLVIVGSRVPDFENRNIHMGKGDVFIVEACEYRESFMNFEPFGMILLNCEWEHVDYYKSEAHYVNAFKKLAQKLPDDGFLIYNNEDKNSQSVAESCSAKKIGVQKKDAKKIELQIPGRFNQMNAAHALKIAEKIGIERKIALESLKTFKGTARRMEVKGEASGVIVIDDYAHHPTEIKATLGALKQKYPQKRIICVFQPHQYSRTLEFLEGFKTAFRDADEIIIPNIYEARDSHEDKSKISAQNLAKSIKNAIWGQNEAKTVEILQKTAKKGDLIITMGAGNVNKIGENYLKKSTVKSW